ncbi:MAG: SurA N-terminal domain-containing protein [Paracoccaceae bacterium]
MKSKINKLFAWLIVFLLVIGLVGFGLQDVISRWGNSKIATIGNKEITSEEFAISFNQEVNYLSRILGQPISITDAKEMGIHLRVLERLINTSLLDQMLKDLQISTGDTFLLKNLQKNQIFKDQAGKFSRENYNLYLDRLNLTEKAFEDILRTDLTRELILNGLATNISVNSNISALITQYSGEERLVSIYKAKENLVQVERTANTSQIEEFFERNKAKYETNQIKKVSYLMIDPVELAKKIEVSDNELLDAFLSQKSDYQKAESRKLNKIVFSKEIEAQLAINEINDQIKTFKRIAEEKNLSDQDLAYGTFEKDQLSAEVAKIVFSDKVKLGSVVGPIIGALGYEIIEINNISPAKTVDFLSAKTTIKKVYSLNKAQELIISMMPELEDMIAAGESLEAISDTMSIGIKSFDWTEGMVPPKPFNLEEFNYIVDLATTEASDIIELESGALITIRLDEEILPKIPELNDVMSIVVTGDFLKQAQLSALEKKVSSILSKLENVNLSQVKDVINYLRKNLPGKPN